MAGIIVTCCTEMARRDGASIRLSMDAGPLKAEQRAVDPIFCHEALSTALKQTRRPYLFN